MYRIYEKETGLYIGTIQVNEKEIRILEKDFHLVKEA